MFDSAGVKYTIPGIEHGTVNPGANGEPMNANTKSRCRN